MQVKSITECAKQSTLQCFRLSFSYHLSFRYLFCLFLSGRLRHVLLYVIHDTNHFMSHGIHVMYQIPFVPYVIQIYAGIVLLCVLFHTERDLPERGFDQAFAECRQKRARKGFQVYAMYYIAQFKSIWAREFFAYT